MYCHEALHLKEKLQTASYNQERSLRVTPTRTLTRRTWRPTWPPYGRAAAGWLPPYCTAGGRVRARGEGGKLGVLAVYTPRIRRAGGGGGEVNTRIRTLLEGQSKYVKYVLRM